MCHSAQVMKPLSVAIIYMRVYSLCVCFFTHLPLSVHSERCVWLEMSLPQVGFFLSSTHFRDPGSVVSSVHPFLLPVHPPAAVSFSIYWLILTWDFLYRRHCCQGSFGWVWYHHCPRIGRSPPEISSLHLSASRVRQTTQLRDTVSRKHSRRKYVRSYLENLETIICMSYVGCLLYRYGFLSLSKSYTFHLAYFEHIKISYYKSKRHSFGFFLWR